MPVLTHPVMKKIKGFTMEILVYKTLGNINGTNTEWNGVPKMSVRYLYNPWTWFSFTSKLTLKPDIYSPLSLSQVFQM